MISASFDIPFDAGALVLTLRQCKGCMEGQYGFT